MKTKTKTRTVRKRFTSLYDKAVFYIRARQEEMKEERAYEPITLAELNKKVRIGLKKLLELVQDREEINVNIGIQCGGNGIAEHEHIGEYSLEDLRYWDALDQAKI